MHVGNKGAGVPAVSVVITVYNEEPAFLAEAIESIFAQTVPAHEIIAVEDGPKRDYSDLWKRFPNVRVINQANAGLAAARNTGIAAATGEFVLFLDGDDRLTPIALAVDLASFAALPDAIMAYGGYRFMNYEGRPSFLWSPAQLGPDPYVTLLEGNCVEMHCTVLYRREALAALGGFAARFRACEDYEMFLRIARHAPIAYSPEILAEYRQHGTNMSSDRSMMLGYLLEMYETQRPHVRGNPAREAALARGIANGKAFYGRRQAVDLVNALRGEGQAGPALKGAMRMMLSMPGTMLAVLGRGIVAKLTPAPRTKTALKDRFTADFLARHAIQRHGRVVEVDEGTALETLSGDNDCVVVRGAFDPAKDPALLATKLKPGGILLLSVAADKCSPDTLAAQLAGPFDAATLDIGFYGNAETAAAAQAGQPAEQFDIHQLCTLDDRHPVIFTACARKAA